MALKTKIIIVSLIGVFFIAPNLNSIIKASSFIELVSAKDKLETKYNPNDSDNDGVEDIIEIELGTDPHISDN